jgi:RHS repeat-associated protein
VYDGDGQRVKKTIPAVSLYWYGATGNVLDETSGNGTLVSEYIFFNGKRVARRDVDNSVKYYFADDLGSASVITNATGAMPPLAESDYYPYGGEIPITSGDPNHYKFTGKERDPESGLDNFIKRYHASSLGRFMTPDPIGMMKQKLLDPQQWNMYSYTRNNPLRFMDPTGMYNTDCKSQDIKGCSKDIQNLDANVKKDLQSKDAAVRAAAAAYGSYNDGNKVNIRFDPNAMAPGEGKQDRDASGKRLDSTTITFQGMTKDSAGRALVAHEGSHVEDFQSFIAGGAKPTAYAGELKAFQTQAGVLLDEPKGANWRVGNSDSHMFIQRPDSKDNIDNNAWAFPTIIDWVYHLTPENPGTFDWEKP